MQKYKKQRNILGKLTCEIEATVGLVMMTSTRLLSVLDIDCWLLPLSVIEFVDKPVLVIPRVFCKLSEDPPLPFFLIIVRDPIASVQVKVFNTGLVSVAENAVEEVKSLSPATDSLRIACACKYSEVLHEDDCLGEILATCVGVEGKSKAITFSDFCTYIKYNSKTH